MDRKTIYFGQIPLETDLLSAQQFTMTAIAKLSAAALGTNTVVNAFTCTPTSPASLNVIVTPGEIYQIEDLEATAWSSIAADTADTILKQGILLQPQTFGITPPTTTGFSQVFLIEAQYQDFDTGSVVLPYFNANKPSSPFSGPANSGSAQNTVRKGLAALQVKAGTAAATGSQVAPTADAGWTGLFLVTVANGAVTITSGNITTIQSAPFVPASLPQVPANVVNGSWVYATDTGTANAYVASVSVLGFQPSSLVAGMEVRIKIANTNTGASTFNLNGLGSHAIVRANQSALSAGDLTAGQVASLTFDGTNWQLSNYAVSTGGTNNFTTVTGLPFATDSGTVNSIIASFTPAVTSGTLVAGLAVEVKIANTITGATTINPNGLGSYNIIFPNGNALTAGALTAGMVAVLVYDGTKFQLISSVDGSVPLKMLTIAGYGQTFLNNTPTIITCFTDIVDNTLSTTTWNGQNLTIGASEGGLWAFDWCISFAPQGGNDSLLSIVRTRGGVVRVMTQQMNGAPDVVNSGCFVIDLQPGDVVNFMLRVDGAAGVYTMVTLGGNQGTPVSPNIWAYRVIGLH